MNSKFIDTGSVKLDSNIKDFFDFYEGPKFQEVKKLISKTDLSKEEIKENIPEDVLAILGLLTDERYYQNILDSVKKLSIPTINQAKEIINKDFSEFIRQPIINGLIKEISFEIKEEDNALLDQFNVPVSAMSIPILTGFPPDLIPATRIGLISSKDEILYEATLQWDDLLFIADIFLGTIEQQLDHYSRLGEEGNLHITNKKRFIRLVKSINSRIDNLTKATPKYGIKIE